MRFTAMSKIPCRSHLRGSNNANGVPIPPSCTALTATISDNEAVMLVAKYTDGPLKLYAGYEHIRLYGAQHPQTAFTNYRGNFFVWL